MQRYETSISMASYIFCPARTAAYPSHVRIWYPGYMLHSCQIPSHHRHHFYRATHSVVGCSRGSGSVAFLHEEAHGAPSYRVAHHWFHNKLAAGCVMTVQVPTRSSASGDGVTPCWTTRASSTLAGLAWGFFACRAAISSSSANAKVSDYCQRGERCVPFSGS